MIGGMSDDSCSCTHLGFEFLGYEPVPRLRGFPLFLFLLFPRWDKIQTKSTSSEPCFQIQRIYHDSNCKNTFCLSIAQSRSRHPWIQWHISGLQNEIRYVFGKAQAKTALGTMIFCSIWPKSTVFESTSIPQTLNCFYFLSASSYWKVRRFLLKSRWNS